MSKWSFVLFLAIALSVYAAMHGFVYWRLASGLSLTAGQRSLLKLLLAAGALSFIAGEFLSRVVANRALLCAGSVWLGILAISLAVFLVEMVLVPAASRSSAACWSSPPWPSFSWSAPSPWSTRRWAPVSRERRIVHARPGPGDGRLHHRPALRPARGQPHLHAAPAPDRGAGATP